ASATENERRLRVSGVLEYSTGGDSDCHFRERNRQGAVGVRRSRSPDGLTGVCPRTGQATEARRVIKSGLHQFNAPHRLMLSNDERRASGFYGLLMPKPHVSPASGS